MLWKRCLAPRPEGAAPALRLLESSLTYQAMSRDPASPSRAVSRAVVVAGGQVARSRGAAQRARAGRPRGRRRRRGRVARGQGGRALRGRARPRRLRDLRRGCVLAVRRITERAPGTAVVVVAPELDEEALLAAVRAGADGFVLETLGASGLVRAVEVALTGDSVIPRAGVGTLIEQLRGATQEQTSVDGQPLKLTRREADVMARHREGMTPKEIAHELGPVGHHRPPAPLLRGQEGRQSNDRRAP